MRTYPLLPLFLLCLSFPAAAWQHTTSDKRWRSGWGQGTAEAEVTNGSGNQIYVACEAGSGRESSVSFQLAGRSAPPDSEVLLIFDGGAPQGVQVDEKGQLIANCRACAANFDVTIAALKTHSSVYVRFSDGRESTFTLTGSTKAIGDCPSNW